MLKVIIVFILLTNCVLSQEISLYDTFPLANNPENGIELLFRDSLNQYCKLFCTESGKFRFTENTNMIPLIAIMESSNQILAHPCAVENGNGKRDAVIKISIPNQFVDFVVVGNVKLLNSGEVRFYIYQNDTNFNSPVWEKTLTDTTGNNSNTNSFSIHFNNNESIYLATDALDNDINDWAVWENVKITLGVNSVYSSKNSVHSINQLLDDFKIFDLISWFSITGQKLYEFSNVSNDDLNNYLKQIEHGNYIVQITVKGIILSLKISI